MKRILIILSVVLVAGIFGIIFPEPSHARTDTAAIMPAVALSAEQAARTQRCPACGGLPEFIFEDDAGTTHLVCRACGKDWRFQNFKCPYCGNEDPETLSYIYGESQGAVPVRCYVCKVCRRFIETTVVLSGRPAAPDILQKSMLNALESEMQAEGYRPGWLG